MGETGRGRREKLQEDKEFQAVRGAGTILTGVVLPRA